MKLEVEFWTLVSLLLAFMGFVFAVAKIFFAQVEKRQDERFRTLEGTLTQFASTQNGLERELMQLKADLPLNYVRREDYIRGQTVIEAKLDAVYSKIEALQLRHATGEK